MRDPPAQTIAISIVGFDDLLATRHRLQSLTAISPAIAELGRRATTAMHILVAHLIPTMRVDRARIDIAVWHVEPVDCVD